MSNVDHPAHYGGEDNPYETIKVLEAWDWKLAYHFCVGNSIKYFSRLGKKNDLVEDLKKAAWYGNKAVEIWERQHNERRTTTVYGNQDFLTRPQPVAAEAERRDSEWKAQRYSVTAPDKRGAEVPDTYGGPTTKSIEDF